MRYNCSIKLFLEEKNMKNSRLLKILSAVLCITLIAGCSNDETLQQGDNESFNIENNDDMLNVIFDNTKWNIIKEAMYENELCENLNDKELFNKYQESVKINAILSGDSFSFNIDNNEQFWSYYLSDSALNILNSKAEAVRNCVDIFLVNADTSGYGMKRDSTEILNITVTDGTWNCTAVDSDYFKSNGETSWGTNGSAKKDDKNINISKGENRLCSWLANDFPEIKNAAFKIGVDSGYCRSVVYIPYRTEPLVLGKDCPDIDVYNACSFIPFEWNEETGLNHNGELVGLAPQSWVFW